MPETGPRKEAAEGGSPGLMIWPSPEGLLLCSPCHHPFRGSCVSRRISDRQGPRCQPHPRGLDETPPVSALMCRACGSEEGACSGKSGCREGFPRLPLVSPISSSHIAPQLPPLGSEPCFMSPFLTPGGSRMGPGPHKVQLSPGTSYAHLENRSFLLSC